MIGEVDIFLAAVPNKFKELLEENYDLKVGTKPFVILVDTFKDYASALLSSSTSLPDKLSLDDFSDQEQITIFRVMLRLTAMSTGFRSCLKELKKIADPVVQSYIIQAVATPGSLEETWDELSEQYELLLEAESKNDTIVSFEDKLDLLLLLLDNAGKRHDFNTFSKLEEEILAFFSKISETREIANELVAFYEALTYSHLSFWLREKGDVFQALEYFELASEIITKIQHPYLLGWLSNNKGAFRIARGEFSEAILNFREAFNQWNKLRYLEGMAFALNNLGVIQNSMGFYSQARESFIQAQNYHIQTKGQVYRTISFSNIASTYRAEGNLNEALVVIHDGLSIELENKSPSLDMLYLLAEKLEILLEFKDILNAKETLLQLSDCIEKLQASSFKSSLHYYTGVLNAVELNFGSAKENLHKAMQLSHTSANTFRLMLKAETQLVRVLISSFHFSKNRNDLLQAFSILDNLLIACKEQNLQSFLYDLLIIKSHLYSIINEQEKAIDTLNDVLEKTKFYGLEIHHTRAKEQLASMAAITHLSEVEKTSKLIEYLQESSKEILSFSVFSQPKKTTTKIYGVLVTAQSGVPVYSDYFDSVILNDDVLISGLLSAVSAFTRELSNKSTAGFLKTITHEDITILLEQTKNEYTIAFFAESDSHNLRVRLLQIAQDIEHSILKSDYIPDPSYSEKNSELSRLIEQSVNKFLPEQI